MNTLAPNPQPTPRATSGGVSLTPDLWLIARQLGAGSASRGIQIALRTYAAQYPVPQHLLGGKQ